MKILHSISKAISTVGAVIYNQFRLVFHDAGALIFFLGLPLLYPIVYTLIYNPEVVEKVAVAVVDDSRSAESRHLVQTASASPTIDIFDYANDMAEARDMMHRGEVFGIMYIPSDYGTQVVRGEQANVSFYSNVALLLRYRALAFALTDLQMHLASEITQAKISNYGLESLSSGGMPINTDANFLGDTEQGFASFVMPGILVLILQQSMLLGIALIEGSSNERRRKNHGIDPQMVRGASATESVIGKGLCYFLLYIPITIYVLRIVPWMFKLPQWGDPTQYLLFIVPLLLASAMFGLALGPLMKERENGFILLVATSIVFLFLSGLTWPRYGMADVWVWIGNLIPAVWGVEGFIRINSNSATLAQNSHPYIMMWVLTVAYALLAIGIHKFRRYRQARQVAS